MDQVWAEALDALEPAMHEVDRNATRIWFRFHSWALAQAVRRVDADPSAASALRLEGRYRLAEQVHDSHWFLYGHRYWALLHQALTSADGVDVASSAAQLATAVRAVASTAASAAGVDGSWLVGIAAAGLMTRQQVGDTAFARPAGPSGARASSPASPDSVVAARQRDDSQGLFGRFRGERRRYSVWFDEGRSDGRFSLVNQQHLTTAAASDKRPYPFERGYPQDGPIPAQCRSGSCGTCWVGVLGGADKLSDVERLEARRMRECGYLDAVVPRPHIRLACMARASGNVTIVIPRWNGFVGRDAPR